MHPLLQALFSRWEWRPEIVVVLVLFGFLYIRGWMHLRQQQGQRTKLATKKRLVSYLSGLAILAIALLSPIDRLGAQLFFMHMIQHLLSIMFVPILLWLASPFPIMMWGMPSIARGAVSTILANRSPLRHMLAAITKPNFAWLAFIVVYVGWHDATAYNLALQRAWVHDVEHLTFFSAAMLYWWHVIGAAPRLHKTLPDWGRMAFLLITIPPNMLAGVAISFAEAPIYTYYESIPRIWGVTIMQDQILGGIIMWIPGSMMFLLAALVVAAQLLKGQDGSAPQSVKDITDDSVMIAPGLEHRLSQNRWRKLQDVGFQKAKTSASDAS